MLFRSPAAETGDYGNAKRTYDAKYLTLSKGLLDAANWSKLGARRDSRSGTR